MVLLGTLVNGLAIGIGAFLGLFLSGMRPDIRETVMQGISLVVILIGVTMALQSDHMFLILIAILIGSLIGSFLGLERGLNRLGTWAERRLGGDRSFSTGFVTATLVYCVGPMAVLGGMDSGLRGDHQILFTKAMLDGFSAIIFSSTLGVGVLLSFVPVVLYQGVIALSAGWMTKVIGPEWLEPMVLQVTAVGGILIIAIGLNLLKVTSIRVGDMLPALVVAAVAAWLEQVWLS
ncbi:hypothetical protein CEN49_22665 [Fischerella thermalis CCMEE 5273]|nr:hypothetical protein CEN49_22665 [Fischerella thermalis CCMEE 5273]